MSLFIDRWRKLSGVIHPDNAPFFGSRPHTFNLNWPPPAYIKDVENAPIILLMMNGGYHSVMTPREFTAEGAVDRYLDMLHNPRLISPKEVSPHYDAANYGQYISIGRLALSNALAYRSGKL